MGRKRIEEDKRRSAIGISLPQELITALTIYSDISGLTRSTIVEHAIRYYLATAKNEHRAKQLFESVYADLIKEEVENNGSISC